MSSTENINWDSLLDDCTYDMGHQRRGLAIVINNEKFKNLKERRGSTVDADAVGKCFEDIGFEVRRRNNLKVREILDLFATVSKEDHSDSDCIAIIILSHGEEGRLYGTDDSVDINLLTDYFESSNCPSLSGKPKLFFIQACRGTDFDDGVVLKSDDETDGTGMDSESFLLEQDFMVAFATVEGYYSFRNRKHGSWFIQAISDVVSRHGKTLDLLSMMTRVSNQVAYTYESSKEGKKQIPCIVSKLTKDLYFPPKSH